jgi:hypothetical protein
MVTQRLVRIGRRFGQDNHTTGFLTLYVGHPGCLQSSDWIRQELRKLGLEAQEQVSPADLCIAVVAAYFDHVSGILGSKCTLSVTKKCLWNPSFKPKLLWKGRGLSSSHQY